MIRILTTLTSDTPHLPELAPLVGREVTITVEEVSVAEALPMIPPRRGDWAAAEAAAEALRESGFDFSFYDRYDEVEQKAAEELGR